MAIRLAVYGSGAASALLSLGEKDIVTVPLVGPIWLGYFGAPMAIVWIVGLTNAYNFMDVIDIMQTVVA